MKKTYNAAKVMKSGSLVRKKALKAAILSAAFSLAAASHSHAGVASTKHNFGSLSPAAVKTTQSSEICVFCHTPHNSNPAGPAWNRQDTGSVYNVYASQSLAATLSPNSPTLGQPTGSSKLCLSCHDGTIAVGSVLNMPGKKSGSYTLPVTGPGIDTGKISATSTSYIGTDLRDDHPISFEYSLSYPSNTEIKADTSPGVKLDSNGRVQCTSCHDPHGTAYTKFLLASMDNAAICYNCHDKRYWDTMPSVHKTSASTWNGLGVNPWHEDLGSPGYNDDTLQLQSCHSCHRSHGGTAGKSLLKGVNPGNGQTEDEEWTCLNCHNGNVASKDMGPVFNNMYRHDIFATYGAHTPSRQFAGDPVRESATSLGVTNRHVECSDCHNSHGTMTGNHTVGGVNGNIAAPNLLGGWGVKPFPWGPAGTEATTYQPVDITNTLPGGNNLEGYVCLKCHSYYAYGFMPPDVPSLAPDNTPVRQSDPTADFNINNFGFHPVFAQGKNTPPVAANPNWPANSLGLTNTFRYVDYPGIAPGPDFYNVMHTSTIACSDCHGSSVTSDPKGVHGSNYKYILRANETGVGSIKNFCYNCHRRDVYGDENYAGPNANMSRVPHPVDGLGVNSPFYQGGPGLGNDGNKFGILCLSCHGGAYDSAQNMMKGIHGSNAAAGPLAGSDPLGYRMMNGACVESHKRATTTTGVELTFRAVNASTDKVCNNNFSNFIGVTAIYNCNNIADCSN